MNRAREALVAAVMAAVASACSWSDSGQLAVTGIDPLEAPTHLDVELRVEGRNLDPTVRVDFGDPGRSPVDDGFSVTLVATADRTRVPLAGVGLSAPGRLRGTLAAHALAGTYDVEVRDPRGRVALLPAAFSVFAPEPGCEVELTGCEDGDLCTESDRCVYGRCQPGTPITCAASDQCHLSGTCNPGSGLCSDPTAPDGTPCIDGDACTQVDTCQSGTCYGQDPIVCVESDQCHLAGTCDPGTGLCSDPATPDGTPCAKVCPSLDQCKDAVCTEVIGTCVNTAPLALVTVSPGGGTAGVTHFTLDASGSTDAETPTTLQFRFDSDGNGSWSDWSTSPTHRHTYSTSGTYTAAVQVRDAAVGGLISVATIIVVVAAPGDEVKVSTALDERDTGATPTSPGGTGLSLREAIAWVNLQPTPKTITLAAPLTITTTGSQRELTLEAAGAAVVAEAGVVLDFAGLNKTCVTLAGPGQRLVGVTLRGCNATFVYMTAASGGSQVAQVTTQVTGKVRWYYGIMAESVATTSRIGPGNDLSLHFIAAQVGANYEVFGNRMHENAVGARVSGSPARLWQNTFAAQVQTPPVAGTGVEVQYGTGQALEILQNVFDRNEGPGLQAWTTSNLTVRNNLFTGNGGYGLSAAAGLTHDHNGYFENVAGPVSAGLSTDDATDVLADPLYVDGPSGDFRLLPQSAMIDKGFDTGLDVNGPLPLHYNGLAPDLGAVETPLPP